ncbi:hypothetical protein [Mycobacterium scrofulaceum]|uniref:Uncharacterized protein n=1 Tax=Mycobacterium scrofulaceum TaxID=1783 RepID=A0A1A2W5I8_MYCSC|nr:hypothetical protein [Mycobacterium scrofulaceum]OBI08480.1 hypothetical protein A5679_09435 [Mycobacterium scrofulaceum]
MTKDSEKNPRTPDAGNEGGKMPSQPAGPRLVPITLAVYRDLRVGMVVIMVMLAAAVLIERLTATCWQLAISAYYYTSAHSIVIAALLALGALFIMYKGSSDTEDALLTLAGVSALIAAMVPQGRPSSLCGRADLPPEYDVDAVTRPNVWAVVISLLLGWGFVLWQAPRNRTEQSRSPGGILALGLFWLIVAVGLFTFIFDHKFFLEQAHGAAGFLLISAFIATVFCTGYLVKREDGSKLSHHRAYRRFYRAMAIVMLVTLIAIVTAHLVHRGWELWVLVMESLLILEFAVYWVVQTIELWDKPDRMERLPDDTQRRIAEARKKGGGFDGFKAELANVTKPDSVDRLLPFL